MHTDWFLTHRVGSDPSFYLEGWREASGTLCLSADDNGTVRLSLPSRCLRAWDHSVSTTYAQCIHLPHSKYSSASCERHCSANNVVSNESPPFRSVCHRMEHFPISTWEKEHIDFDSMFVGVTVFYVHAWPLVENLIVCSWELQSFFDAWIFLYSISLFVSLLFKCF